MQNEHLQEKPGRMYSIGHKLIHLCKNPPREEKNHDNIYVIANFVF